MPDNVKPTGKYHISIAYIKPNNAPGTQFQILVENATSYIDAIRKAEPQLIKELSESGLFINE